MLRRRPRRLEFSVGDQSLSGLGRRGLVARRDRGLRWLRVRGGRCIRRAASRVAPAVLEVRDVPDSRRGRALVRGRVGREGCFRLRARLRPDNGRVRGQDSGVGVSATKR
jgi:hypothetical protein